MAQFLSDELGAQNDSVVLQLGSDQLLIATSWSVTQGVLSQPGSWTISVGWGGTARDLLAQYPKRTPYKLYVGNVLQATGRLDAVHPSQPIGGASTIEFTGRDALAPLLDTYVSASVGVKVATYPDLVWYALQQVGLAPAGAIQSSILQVDNAANRKLKAGVPVNAILPHRTVEQILADAGTPGNVGTVTTTPSAKVGETWHHFVRRYLDRAGLMLWAAGDGTFVLAAPLGEQQPTYSLYRPALGSSQTGGSNVIGADLTDDATHRHSEVIVYGRGGGKILGRTKAKGVFQDQEMMGLGYTQPKVIRDKNVSSPAEAAYRAQRMLAEERRAGWKLEYTVSGLTLPFVGDGGNSRAVLTPDTVVAVNDEEYGISGNYYIESVTFSRVPQTNTKLRLMRLTDLVFGGADEGEDGNDNG